MQREPAIILNDEVRIKIRKSSRRKVIKAIDECGVDVIHKLCQRIWIIWQWPEDWADSVFINLHKEDRRTYSFNITRQQDPSQNN